MYWWKTNLLYQLVNFRPTIFLHDVGLCNTDLIQALGDAGKFEEADREFSKAIELEPDNATALVHRG